MTNPFLARFQNEPAMVAPESREWFTSCLQQAAITVAKIEAATDAPTMDSTDFWFAPDDWRAMYRPYVVKDGILQIPVKGVLLNNLSYSFGSYATGYEYIWRAFDRGQKDEEVKGIALVCDTPGGMVAGNFELVDRIYNYPNRKPVRGYAHESAYSAGYSIISSADTVTVSRTGGVGSIGVVTSHIDISKMMNDIGEVITFIHAGKHKVDGNIYNPLPDDVKARIQARVDDLYSIFTSTVARNRKLDEQAVRDTEALCYSAPDALSIGLADKIGTLDDALADFSASLTLDEGDETMADYSQAQFDEAVAAARTEGMTAGKAAGVTEGAAAMQARISAILDSEEAATRPAAARMLAFDTDKDAESARASLAKLPEEAKAAAPAPKDDAAAGAGAPKGMFTAAMDKIKQPNISADDGEKDGEKGVNPKSLRNLAASVGLKGYAKVN